MYVIFDEKKKFKSCVRLFNIKKCVSDFHFVMVHRNIIKYQRKAFFIGLDKILVNTYLIYIPKLFKDVS